ncbi:MAG TPA: hypothetical protein VK680_12705 [Solirubrobacteraceae bacterium]|jgi:hypothetical protein|nr:hypothetical protein [Solirubrobacteraceae bacterium]
MSAADTSTEQQLQAELERLRARMQALELELVEVQTHANSVVAEWQDRVYWLERWHLDLNALMRRPGAAEFRTAVRAVRAVVRAAKKTKRRLQGQ